MAPVESTTRTRKAEPTPRPWKIETESVSPQADDTLITNADGDETVAACFLPANGIRRYCSDGTEYWIGVANARLIVDAVNAYDFTRAKDDLLDESIARENTLRARVAKLEAALREILPVDDDPVWGLRDDHPIHRELGTLRAARAALGAKGE